jgi:3-methyladenine DNA glycosylase AlkD
MEASSPQEVRALAGEIEARLRGLPSRDTASVRSVRRLYSRRLAGAEPAQVLALARMLIERHGRGWVAYELIRAHAGAFRRIGARELEGLGRDLEGWGGVDAFARILAGPAWLRRQVPDALIRGWARSPDRWRRRAALVSTVALNQKSDGGTSDRERTLDICRRLAADRDDMVEKALSWALRALSVPDPGAVRRFLGEHEGELAARVKREVGHKLRTGLKHPRRDRAASNRPCREASAGGRDN